jgi:hypothetical protein
MAQCRADRRLEAEIVVLRHQLNVLRRRIPAKPRLAVPDRLILVWVCRLFPSALSAVTIIQPETVLRWHRQGFRWYWRSKSGSPGGRPKVPIELRSLIRRMSLENRLWRAPRIHGELLKLGYEVAQSTVAKYMTKRRPDSSQTWKTFLRNHAAGIAAMDFLVVPTVGFRLLFILVILRHKRRRLVSLSVTDHPTAEWIARQITDSFPWCEAPDHLIRDRDAAYGRAVSRRLAAMGIPGSSDRASIALAKQACGEADRGDPPGMRRSHRRLWRGPSAPNPLGVRGHYNEVRTHLAVEKDSPSHRPIRRFGQVVARPILGGLHHQYCRI